jgi:hypothetical protein
LLKAKAPASPSRGLAAGCRLGVSTCTLQAPAGTLASTLTLAPSTVPGRYRIEVSGTVDGAAIAPLRVPLVIPAPVEGVVDKVLVSTTVRGADLATVPNAAPQFFVTFRFAALPKRPRLTLVVRYPNGRTAIARNRYKAARIVPVRQRKPPGGDHETGTWRFTLKSGDRVIAKARVEVVS